MYLIRARVQRGITHLTLLAALCACLPVTASDHQDLVFTVQLEADQVELEQPILVTFQLTHRGDEPVYVNRRFYIGSAAMARDVRDVYFEVTGPDGSALSSRYEFETGLPKTDDFQLMQPGESMGLERGRDLRAYFAFTEPGAYSVIGVYDNGFGSELGLDVFDRTLRSEPVSLTITERGS